ncbi:rhomboid family intramembrane serine protease [Candidatus Eisenbacteria bacterium]|uniref:Rhomboid family intramembrane serine protease n=1 Tax=Eiseniibacteriota bacterium TaxID=2212470 RepID=A0ABV6YKK7_UNCEI
MPSYQVLFSGSLECKHRWSNWSSLGTDHSFRRTVSEATASEMTDYYLDRPRRTTTQDQSGRQIAQFSFVLGLLWVIASIALAIAGRGQPADEQLAVTWFALGNHPQSSSPMLLQLLTYPFIHDLGIHLIFSVIGLRNLTQIGQLCTNLDGFIRLYVFGTVFGGLAFVRVAEITSLETPLIGATLALHTMIGAFAVFKPNMTVKLFFLFDVRLVWIAIGIGSIWILLLRGNAAFAAGQLTGLGTGVLYALVDRFLRGRFGQ